MRILLVHDYARQYGGAEVMLDAFAAELRRLGHDVARFTSSAGLADDSPMLIEQPRYTCTGTLGRARGVLQAANPWAPSVLRRAIREFTPDVVHVKMFLTQLSPLILRTLRRTPTIHHAVWYRTVCPTGTRLLPTGVPCNERVGAACLRHGCVSRVDWPGRMLQHALLARWRHVFRRVVANSEHTRAELTRHGMPVDAVIPNGITEVPASATPAAEPTVVFVGRLTFEKGVDVLLESLAALAADGLRIRADIVGEGPERASLEQRAEQYGLGASVRFHGQQSREHTDAIARRAWLAVVPSRWAEPFGVVALEAMMRGTPVVATTTGGLAEIVTPDVTGWCVPPASVDALRATLAEALRDRTRLARMGAAAHEDAITRFGLRAHAARFVAQYQLALASASSGPVASAAHAGRA